MIVLAASTVATTSMRVLPVSRSIAPGMFRRWRPLVLRQGRLHDALPTAATPFRTISSRQIDVDAVRWARSSQNPNATKRWYNFYSSVVQLILTAPEPDSRWNGPAPNRRALAERACPISRANDWPAGETAAGSFQDDVRRACHQMDGSSRMRDIAERRPSTSRDRRRLQRLPLQHDREQRSPTSNEGG
jgi:hypothetical protein